MTDEMKLEFRNMRDMSEALITRIYDEILQPNFGPEELDSLETVLGGLSARGTVLGLCAMDGEDPVGCLLRYPYAEALLIGYVAVRKDRRGEHAGSELFDQVRRRWFGERGVKLVVGEIEDPRCHPMVGDISPERRVAFYERQGVQIAVGPYFQPCLSDGGERVYDLFLTALTDSASGPQKSVPAKPIADFLLAYFKEAEGKNWPGPTDGEGQRLLAWYQDPEHEVVPLHPIADYNEIEIPDVR
jgi:hypothetical protein